MKWRLAGLAAAATALAVALGAAVAPAQPLRADSGVGDPFFPSAGNTGYDVGHYDLRFTYRPGRRLMAARARIEATATESLTQFTLDYRGPKVGRVRVDGEKAHFERSGPELVVTPATAIAAGAPFATKVSYRGRPHNIRDADGSKDGWIPTDDGAFVVGEPLGSPTWFPCNDHPTDKASLAVRATVPHGFAAISNGRS